MENFVDTELLQNCVVLRMASTSLKDLFHFKSAVLLHLTDGEMDLIQCQPFFAAS